MKEVEMGWFRRLLQGRAEETVDITPENAGNLSNVGGDVTVEREVRAVEASLEEQQEKASEEKVAGMIEPISLGAVGVFALTQAIKFLHAEAGELLKHRRESKDGARQEGAEPELRPPADIIERAVYPARPNAERLARLEAKLRERRRSIADYADDVDAVDPSNVALLEHVDELRRLIEVIYGQRITFKGEDREPSGPLRKNEVQAMEAKIHGVKVRVVDSGGGGLIQQIANPMRAKIEASKVGRFRRWSERREQRKTDEDEVSGVEREVE
jgi:hypothetical protein